MGKKKGKGKGGSQGASGDQAGPSTSQPQQLAPQPTQPPHQPSPQPQQPSPQPQQPSPPSHEPSPQPQQPAATQGQKGPKQKKKQRKQQQGESPQQQQLREEGPQQQQQRQQGFQQQQQWQQGPQQQQQRQQGPPQQQQQQQGPPQQQQQQGRQQRQQGPPEQQQSQFQQWRQPQAPWGGPPPQQAPPGFAQPMIPQQQFPPGYQQPQGFPQQPQQWRQPRPQQGPAGPQQGPPFQQQQRQGPPQQQQPRQGPPQQQQQRQGPPQQQQQRQGPPQQQQQRQGPPQEQQPRQQKEVFPPQQEQQSQQSSSGGATPKQQPKSEPSPLQRPTPPKEGSPPLTGGGDCLKQIALVAPGTKGRKILIESNHLSLNVGTRTEAIHYDVAITPDTPKCLLRDVMNRFREKHFPKRFPAFDGRKNLYSPTRLPLGENDIKSDVIKILGENGREKEFKIEVKFARMVDLSPLHDMLKTKRSPQDALQCLDIVLRNAPSNTCITAGRCFFTPPTGQIIELGDGMEMYYGFYQSAIRGWKPLLNVDVAHKAFPRSQSLLDVVCEMGSDYRNTMNYESLRRGVQGWIIEKVEKFVKNLKVKYEITNQPSSKRIHRVNGLGASAARAVFTLENGSKSTVEEYFRTQKRIKLNYPDLPTLWVGSKDRLPQILLPMEFCSILEGQAVNRKMNEIQTSAMIKKSATSTEVRKKKIMDSLHKANYNDDPCIREFGFSVNNQFEKLEARVLQPPTLMYNNNTVKPARGVWRSDNSRFLVGATINKWTIACVTRYPARGVEQLADMILKQGGPSGMNFTSKAQLPFTQVSGRQALPDIIQYFKTKQDFDLIFVVVPNSGPQYSYVKQAAELNVGCLTQCIKERTLMKLNAQTVGNILLKVNSKMNGKNHCFDGRSRPLILARPCMIMGADVTHPSPDAKDIPSVAAVTASHDPKAFQYNICWRLQPPKMEIIEDLCDITVEQLNFFYKKTNNKPETIVFFRDGVSEGQFEEVQQAEIKAIRNACKKVQKDGYEPKITFLVVQKRHHTRLFPTNPRDSEDKNFNVPAGTCVDTLITNPMMQDFYLVSHASIQGVAKPTKYCTLWDDNNMDNDSIQELTYHLCHMFTRCNRAVSYPAPTYYAHLAAARAKVYIENDRLRLDQLKKQQDKYQIKESICKGKPMFFV